MYFRIIMSVTNTMHNFYVKIVAHEYGVLIKECKLEKFGHLSDIGEKVGEKKKK